MNNMSNEEKLKIVNRYLEKLMRIAENGAEKGNNELSLSALSAYCNIQYEINQVYTSEKAENLLREIGKKLVTVPDDYEADSNTVLFYDGFGLDLRGWAASYAKALGTKKYRVIYIEPLKANGSIPHVEKEVVSSGGTILYVDMNHSYVSWIKEINRIINCYRPKAAFFYTTPNDVSGAVVFNAYSGIIRRIMIDLTDHAFWIGVKGLDIVPESRELGVSNAVFHRGIPIEKIARMDGCPYLNKEVNSEPLPFNIEKERYVFSGGSLYKTLGDKNLLYYKIVDHILETHNNIKFLYAGYGDDRELIKIVEKYPGRAFHIHERSDFFRLFENCLFFLNTYPMFGGLMMRYAALAGKIPLTLEHGSDHEGVLNAQKEREIEFTTYESLLLEADKLISDDEYRRKKELKLKGAVTTEEEFADRVSMLIEEGRTELSFGEVEEIETKDFRAEYIERINTEDMLTDAIAKKRNILLLSYFPKLFLNKIMRRLCHD